MTSIYYFNYIVAIIVISTDCRNPEIDKPVKEMVEKYGYEFEAHEVVTEDDYLLGVHRVPNSIMGNSSLPPVLMMHGLVGASHDWVITGPNRSLAFLLSDNGFDVWMGNNRGNTYSKEHKAISSRSSKFWNFSWHEFGIYDAPAIIDYILNITGHNKLIYIGFSQGCTQFYVMTSMKPEYNDKILVMAALAPAVFAGHMQGLLPLAAPFVYVGRTTAEWVGYMEVLFHSKYMTSMTDEFCREGSPVQYMCEMVLFSIGGLSMNDEVDKKQLSEYLHYSPAGCSNKQLYHYGMGIMSGRFRQYDYGFLKNLQVYHAVSPPDYQLSNVDAPIFIYNGLNDYLADLRDVTALASELRNVISMYTVKVEKLNHFDFQFGLRIRELVYDRLLNDVMSYSDKYDELIQEFP